MVAEPADREDCVNCVTQSSASNSQRYFLKKRTGFSSLFSDGFFSQPEHALAEEPFLRKRRNSAKPTTAITMMIARISCVPIATSDYQSFMNQFDRRAMRRCNRVRSCRPMRIAAIASHSFPGTSPQLSQCIASRIHRIPAVP